MKAQNIGAIYNPFADSVITYGVHNMHLSKQVLTLILPENLAKGPPALHGFKGFSIEKYLKA